MLTEKDMTTVSGYEVEKKTLANIQANAPEVFREVKACFRHLRKHGVLVYTYDDGYSLEAMLAVRHIANDIGLTCYGNEPYQLVVIDEESHKEFCRDAKI